MRLSQQDASFIYQETASGPMQTAGILVVEGEVGFDAIYKHYAARVHLVPRLRQRMVFVPFNLAHPKWVDDPDFDLTNHIVHHEIEPGASIQAGLDRLCEVNEALMDRSIPLWKFHVLTGVKGHTLILQQAHHAMIDGASAIQMSTVLLDFEQDAETPAPPEADWNPPPIPSPAQLMNEAVQDNVRGFNPAGFGVFANAESRSIMQKGVEALTKFFTQPVITAPWNASAIGPKRKLAYSVHTLAEFREVRRAFGGTINDVALAIVTEGVARYLEKHNEATTNQNLRVMCPVNVRTEDEKGALGNRVSAIFPTLPAYSLPIEERYQAVCNETGRIKGGGEAQAMTLMMESMPEMPPLAMVASQLVSTPLDPTRLAAAFPPALLPNVFGRGPNYGVNFVLTNVPGVQVAQYIAGHEVVEMTAIMMMGGNMGLGIAVSSYNQKMIFNYTADPRMLPDLAVLDELCREAYAELLSAARAKAQSDAA